jgi:hypothetical protein
MADIFRYTPRHEDGQWVVVDTVSGEKVGPCKDEKDAYALAVDLICGKDPRLFSSRDKNG